MAKPNGQAWFSSTEWHERIITFDPSWFTVTMSTGVIVQLLNFFPWPAQWLKSLGYAFWVLDIVLFAFFSTMGVFRAIMYPKITLSIIDDFSQTSYLGAIPISVDTIAVGISLYYHSHERAMYVAEVLYWIAVSLTAMVGIGGVFAMHKHQGKHNLEDVTGVWLLSFIPMIVTASLGSNLVPYLLGNNSASVLIVSILMLALGVGLSFIITTIYIWRLMVCSLPPRDAIVSCFVPVGPFSMGAFAILGLSIDLSRFVVTTEFMFDEAWSSPLNAVAYSAVGQIIIWIGVISAMMLLGVATFFLLEAFASVISRVPKTFNIGFWSFVFPCGVYANAWCRLSTTLRNDGMKGWAAACVVSTILLWLMCAVLTVYKGVWQGKVFVAPGLQGHAEQQELDHLRKQSDTGRAEITSSEYSTARERTRVEVARRNVLSDGTLQRGSPAVIGNV